MGGVETFRGIGYQHAHAVLTALDVLNDERLGALRVEGVRDVMDIEVHDVHGRLVLAKQVKIRDDKYSWAKKELLDILLEWAALEFAEEASFEFVTDGRLGPSGEAVRVALEAAADGDAQPLATLLDVDESAEICVILGRARIRQEPTGVEPLLLEAHREVCTLLPGDRTSADLDERAWQAVDRISQRLLVRAGSDDESVRLVTKAEIAEFLGGIDHLPKPDRWPGSLRSIYLDTAAQTALEGAVSPRFTQLGPASITRTGEDDGFELGAVLDAVTPILLAGRTGSGKTTSVRLLRREAALRGRTVLVGHAETYVSGRLDAFTADAASAVVGRDLPAATGRQLLNDPEVLLVIDGVSEVPAEVRRALRYELRVPVAASQGARVLVAGRDAAVLATVFPTSVMPVRLGLMDLGSSRRRVLVQNVLASGDNATDDHTAAVVQAQAEKALGDAAGNPMLFTMALGLLGRGIAFTDRASLYEATITMLAERGGASDIEFTAAALGIIFAELLDDERRYANRLEWARLISSSVDRLNALGIPLDTTMVLEACERTGLVVPIGHAQTQAPIHDSYADYLAGKAHSDGFVRIPETLCAGDEQRILFAAEIGGVTAQLAGLVARDLPFTSVRAAAYDRRPLAEDSPDEVAALLALLTPGEPQGVSLWRDGDRVIASLAGGVSRWTERDAGQVLMRSVPTAICGPSEGPLILATRLWRLILLEQLNKPPETLGPGWIGSLEEARSTLMSHATAETEALAELVTNVAPSGRENDLSKAVGPFGLTACVFPVVTETDMRHWPVIYRHSDGIDVQSVATPEPADTLGWGSSTVEYLVRRSANESAAARVKTAINELTSSHWL